MNWRWMLPALLAWGIGIPAAWGHGVSINYEVMQAIRVQAKYDSGDPMENAQVTVYAPNNPAEAWRTGTTDEQGYYVFIPNREITGNWEVKVRKAGHGNITTIPVEKTTEKNTEPTTTTTTSETTASGDGSPVQIAQMQGGSTGYTPLQRTVMGMVVVWGCVGTALFFMSRRR
ncbi:carboxypeptidase-like regulatory domain-containing protein [Geitlerinema sp. PCC 9228]|jgi:nickel transport protein|uniref:carboxypeptidase-like regulatory domain-containing protein n=1 Tax=Geitlerinema sp. PCC 9228 TaxID=111611 RepID=UPI0008F9B551|nr:carboxypeptidase-like regulatory domain-containing protein [Geitlerinema sp. PCC 9228]